MLINNKIIDIVDPQITPLPPEKKVATTILEGEYKFSIGKDVREELRKYCGTKGISFIDYATVTFSIAEDKPFFLRNDDYFTTNRQDIKRWYLPHPDSKIIKQEQQLLKDLIFLSLEKTELIKKVSGDKRSYISNVYAENSLQEEEARTTFYKEVFFQEIRKVLTRDIEQHYGHFREVKEEDGVFLFSEKDRIMMDKEIEERLQAEKEWLFTHFFRKPLVKFWLKNDGAKYIIMEYKVYQNTLMPTPAVLAADSKEQTEKTAPE